MDNSQQSDLGRIVVSFANPAKQYDPRTQRQSSGANAGAHQEGRASGSQRGQIGRGGRGIGAGGSRGGRGIGSFSGGRGGGFGGRGGVFPSRVVAGPCTNGCMHASMVHMAWWDLICLFFLQHWLAGCNCPTVAVRVHISTSVLHPRACCGCLLPDPTLH